MHDSAAAQGGSEITCGALPESLGIQPIMFIAPAMLASDALTLTIEAKMGLASFLSGEIFYKM
jgi:hypothetical protein